MRIRLLFFIAVLMIVSACSQAETKTRDKDTEERFVLVEGGTFVSTKSNYYGEEIEVKDFYIGKYEVTQKEWYEVMGTNPSLFKGDDRPVEMVSWYEAVEYCNLRSIREGLEPYYNIDKETVDPHNKSEYDPVKWTVTINPEANGYRLPTDIEWEYAASGGKYSKSYIYSGSHDADEVAWHWRNAGDEYLTGDWNWPVIESNNSSTKPVGSKEPNELGLYDMSGNVREWVWDWYEDDIIESGYYRIVRGGGWIGDVVNTEISIRGRFEASGLGPDQGFRLARNAS
ncbi:hypothetical protein PRECH8_25050 [Insulibacter thermoxylanivorax]|uniref:Sulfatase-modifying factor enzyme-like domain-containing protein n=1 Tax=Insulibacter thermoxylanivorax TaxID=2749268 RepID=A0A916QGF9_9BACL|nr:SUMF1/EgtB/PvdO family nonheme iron enzyme [Insulibacter thermoxylanivorax]GFR39209.1 hypothetical protein PRECH8_25050 [Insulibacter thermoxylanivorax]